MTMMKWKLGVIPLFLIFVVCIAFSALSLATEMPLYVPSYEGEELAAVREWEKTWAGKRVDKTNVDQVSEYLLDPVAQIIRDPEYMNAKEYWFEIIPYRQAYRSKGQIEMTKKCVPIAKLDGDNLVDYENMAGNIFPQPKSGIEVAYNFDMQTYGDSGQFLPGGSVVEPRTGFDRESTRDVTRQYWVHRVYTEPFGNTPQNKKKFHYTQHSVMLSPPDFFGNVILEVKYSDLTRDTDKWVFMNRFRRIRRVTTTQRADQIDGTEMIFDDSPRFWGDHVNRNNYKLLGRKELLQVRHQDTTKAVWAEKSGVYNGLQRERINTYVVEAVYKKPNYAYTKQVWYLDPETWIILTKQCWDEDGNFWRHHEEHFKHVKTINDEYAYTTDVRTGWDMKGRHASHNKGKRTENVGKFFKAKMFSVHNIQKRSY
jgi:outer membrane lipoprotein-sorting protein